MKTKRELKVNYLATIIVCGKPMQLSTRDTKKGVKCYLHSPSRKVTVDYEISKDLFFSIYNLYTTGTNN